MFISSLLNDERIKKMNVLIFVIVSNKSIIDKATMDYEIKPYEKKKKKKKGYIISFITSFVTMNHFLSFNKRYIVNHMTGYCIHSYKMTRRMKHIRKQSYYSYIN